MAGKANVSVNSLMLDPLEGRSTRLALLRLLDLRAVFVALSGFCTGRHGESSGTPDPTSRSPQVSSAQGSRPSCREEFESASSFNCDMFSFPVGSRFVAATLYIFVFATWDPFVVRLRHAQDNVSARLFVCAFFLFFLNQSPGSYKPLIGTLLQTRR